MVKLLRLKVLLLGVGLLMLPGFVSAMERATTPTGDEMRARVDEGEGELEAPTTGTGTQIGTQPKKFMPSIAMLKNGLSGFVKWGRGHKSVSIPLVGVAAMTILYGYYDGWFGKAMNWTKRKVFRIKTPRPAA